MIGRLREFRLVPIVLFATISLFALKSISLLIDGHYALDDSAVDEDITGTIPGAARHPGKAGASGKQGGAGAQSSSQSGSQSGSQSWAQQMFNYPDVTASAEGKPGAKDAAAKNPAPAKGNATGAAPEEPPNGTKGWKPVPIESGRVQSAAEIALLERLQERRAELDARAKEIEMRESLLKAAEKRLEGRIAELKELEARINGAVQQREESELARFKNVVTMYENMKAKDAAKIFDRFESKFLADIAKEINPRRLSDIMAQMTPDAAQQLTVELAVRTAAKEKEKAAELPKIEGKPTN
jgi:flagellar motility protein MotE (MotC chaperone)